MSPANIEATLKARLAADRPGRARSATRRPYNTALIVLDPDFARRVGAKQHGLDGQLARGSWPATSACARRSQAGVDEANAQLARVEQIKQFTILAGDWQPGGDELTPTMKLKRKPIAEKYAAEIEALYQR